tara:strand:- start:156 stop:323 length:168 start_codon:yes stop_codon:yes gene_type:complete
MSRRKKRLEDGMEKIEYLYVCEECNNEMWSDSKRLLMSCPPCRNKGVKTKMEIYV